MNLSNKLRTMAAKRGYNISFMGNAAIALIAAAITIVVGVRIMSQVQSLETVNSTAYNVSSTTVTAMSSFADWFTIIVLVIVAVIVLGFLRYIRGVSTE